MPSDTDSTFDWLATFDRPRSTTTRSSLADAGRAGARPPGRHWMIAFNDAGWRKKYADAMAALLARWDVGQIQGWIDTWSQQIGPDVAADPHAWATPDRIPEGRQHRPRHRAKARGVPADLRRLRERKAATDEDGDGYRWCDDCRDDDANIHLGAAELCNGVDDNCNGMVDEGCP